ncbi:hypothetical protein BDR07DRAFT_1465586 [Suillus spraguei]|nr:hypothetical protein BDR07DRAFT_1465586 [Suillus spraguei]
MSANGSIDWRPITICVMSDILAMGADYLKNKEEEFPSDRNNANDTRVASWFIYALTFLTTSSGLLALALFQCLIFTTVMFVAPAMLWTTPISFKSIAMISRRLFRRFGRDKHQPCTSAPVMVIKHIPGMKAIFNDIIRGCGIYTGNLTITLPSAWSVVQFIVWSTVNRSCHAIMTDVRDFEDDMKADIPTIPVLLGCILKTKA